MVQGVPSYSLTVSAVWDFNRLWTTDQLKPHDSSGFAQKKVHFRETARETGRQEPREVALSL